MVTKIPPKLYKFQSFENKNSIENLRHCKIWFPKPEGLNDPFDCAIPYNFVSTGDKEVMAKFLEDYYFEDLRKDGETDQIQQLKLEHFQNGKPDQVLLNLAKKVFPEWGQSMIEKISQMGVACFTTELKNILMWAHYANGHKGFCLEFDTSLFAFSNKLHEVIYSSSYPTLSPLDFIGSSRRLEEPLYTKSKDWRYEKEWRWLKRDGDSAIVYNPKALTAIYFGSSAKKENIEKITTMPAKSAPRLYQMQRSSTEFKLEYMPYQK